ncbi:MAG: O-sialoglycoprotein endopeptidase [Acidaminococcaceae bacterium]
MIKREVYLGIDTSCYTTSVALIDRQGSLVAERRRILEVKLGAKGLAQSEMVFQHTRNLPELMEEILDRQNMHILGIGVSKQPRPVEESYMPAFLTGYGLARSLAVALTIPLLPLSHQENHLEAGLWSAQGPQAGKFLLLHASGGTTDILLATREETGRYHLTYVGGSIDLHAGQFIDRIGVALGLQFPTGPALEQMAATAKIKHELPIAVQKNRISLSGPATAALRALTAGAEPAALALGVEYTLAETFVRCLRNIAKEQQVQAVLLVGGVASNRYIREHIITRLQKYRIRVYIPEAKFSGDNATGCAVFAQRMLEK